MGKIILEGADNARDLGGTPSRDGRRVRPHMFIRSEALDRLSPGDINILAGEYGLKTIIDLRTHVELQEKPDAVVPGAAYLHIPIFDEETAGISRGKKTQDSLMHGSMPEMGELYRTMVREPSSVAQFKKVFEHILEAGEGAVLWHCTAGKDRCGLTSAFLLYLLDVDMDGIYEDYLRTNEIAIPLAERFSSYVFAQTQDRDKAESLRRAFIADSAYLDAAFDEIEKQYGGMEGFVEKGLGISEEAREQFKNRALTHI